MVVMLCDPDKSFDGPSKCLDYNKILSLYSDNKEFNIIHDPQHHEIQINKHVIERTFTIKHIDSGLMREVKHYSFLKWIDKDSVDENKIAEDNLIELVDLMVKHREHTSTPIMTHCSAGVGRSGTT